MPKFNHKTQVAIYSRISSKDKQSVQNQLRELRKWTKKVGYKVYNEYIDNESRSKAVASVHNSPKCSKTQLKENSTWFYSGPLIASS